jgi:hypothetical protein
VRASHEPAAVRVQPADDDGGAGAIAAVLDRVGLDGGPAVGLPDLRGGAAQLSISACSSALRAGAQAAGVVEYTPEEYLLMTPPLAPTNP